MGGSKVNSTGVSGLPLVTCRRTRPSSLSSGILLGAATRLTQALMAPAGYTRIPVIVLAVDRVNNCAIPSLICTTAGAGVPVEPNSRHCPIVHPLPVAVIDSAALLEGTAIFATSMPLTSAL